MTGEPTTEVGVAWVWSPDSGPREAVALVTVEPDERGVMASFELVGGVSVREGEMLEMPTVVPPAAMTRSWWRGGRMDAEAVRAELARSDARLGKLVRASVLYAAGREDEAARLLAEVQAEREGA